MLLRLFLVVGDLAVQCGGGGGSGDGLVMFVVVKIDSVPFQIDLPCYR